MSLIVRIRSLMSCKRCVAVKRLSILSISSKKIEYRSFLNYDGCLERRLVVQYQMSVIDRYLFRKNIFFTAVSTKLTTYIRSTYISTCVYSKYLYSKTVQHIYYAISKQHKSKLKNFNATHYNNVTFPLQACTKILFKHILIMILSKQIDEREELWIWILIGM